MSEAVMADAQFSVSRILRPYTNFETDYQGGTATRPIYLTEVVQGPGGEPVDELAAAGQAGYNPNLVRGIPTPLGSRVMLWIPKVTSGVAGVRYTWLITWRLRNVHDFRLAHKPYHYPKQGQGDVDSTVVPAAARVVIPACNETVIYTAATPATPNTGVVQTAVTESFSFGGDDPPLPHLPGAAGAGVIQQGVLDPSDFPTTAPQPIYQWIDRTAMGDELLIAVRRTLGGGANWDFATPGGEDATLARLLGSASGTETPRRDVGVYVMTGSAP